MSSCQLNPHYLCHTHDYNNSPSKLLLAKLGVKSVGEYIGNIYRQYEFNHHDAYVVGHVDGEILHQNFVFGARDGLAFIDENGKGATRSGGAHLRQAR